MKKKIIGALVVMALIAVVFVGVLPANAAAGVLDHVQITPTSATVPVGSPVQFLAQSYDSNNAVITGVTYQWSVSGGGTISTTGLFTAGTTIGKFNVQVTATQGTLSKTATAVVKVTANTSNVPVTNMETNKLSGMLESYLNSVGFSNFLGGQWQVKNGSGTDTIKAIPGVVQAVSGTSLTILPNGQTTPSTFTLASGTLILPKGTQLAVNDQIVVITVNDQVKVVTKIIAPSTQGDDEREGNETSAGSSQGKEVSHSDNQGNNNQGHNNKHSSQGHED
jgi:hypothetical protein